MELSLGTLKKYLLSLTNQQNYIDTISGIINDVQLSEFINIHEKEFYDQSVILLTKTKSYKALESHIMIMNALYHNNDYLELKNDLYTKISHKKISVQSYKVLKQLYDGYDLISQLYNHNQIDLITTAQFYLIDGHYEKAYHLLKQLSDLEDQKVLKLLSSYSYRYYLSLKIHYYFTRKDLKVVTA